MSWGAFPFPEIPASRHAQDDGLPESNTTLCHVLWPIRTSSTRAQAAQVLFRERRSEAGCLSALLNCPYSTAVIKAH